MISSPVRRALALACVLCSIEASAKVGADLPWTTTTSAEMRTNGRVLGPDYRPNQVGTESTGQQWTKLAGAGDYVEFSAAVGADALVLRYSLPDAAAGGGTATQLDLLVNGKPVRRLDLTSRYSWLYGDYPFSNDPAKGKPRNFYDELRTQGLDIRKGDLVRLQRVTAAPEYCIVDLVDLETTPAPLAAPAGALSVLDFGADPSGQADATAAVRRGVAAAQAQGRTVWFPSGAFKVTGEILVPSGVTLQGAGMWHTVLVGDDSVYGHADRRVRIKLVGSRIHLADFSILGRLSYRNDNEPNDGIISAACADSSISRIWIEHTKVGIWIYNGVNLTIEGCRFRDTIADGVNLCVGTSGTVIRDCAARGTGDDCFAIWPAPSDQGFVGQGPRTGANLITHCTGQLTFLANGAAVYGGAGNRVEACRFTDIGTGCGVLVSTTFPTSDDRLKIDNNFSGTTLVKDCQLLRCGGYDHSWAWRGSLQVCLDRRSIAGLVLRDVSIEDSISSGVTIVAPGSAKGEGTLSDTRFEDVRVSGSGLGGSPHHDLWVYPGTKGGVALENSSLPDTRIESDQFSVTAAK